VLCKNKNRDSTAELTIETKRRNKGVFMGREEWVVVGLMFVGRFLKVVKEQKAAKNATRHQSRFRLVQPTPCPPGLPPLPGLPKEDRAVGSRRNITPLGPISEKHRADQSIQKKLPTLRTLFSPPVPRAKNRNQSLRTEPGFVGVSPSCFGRKSPDMVPTVPIRCKASP